MISFENPCLTLQERIEGEWVLKSKSYEGKLDFVFIGQLVDTKGILRIIEAFKQFQNESRIGLIHFIGDGKKRGEYDKLVRQNNLNCLFHGFLCKADVNTVLAKAHVLLLPSDSEGFPKVVAEGANYGCIPIVSDISCLSQYVKDNISGYVMPSLDTEGLLSSIHRLISISGDDLKQMAHSAYKMGEHFTYDYYNLRIARDILSQV
jgi:glycosyltransferase involved in cell wall biosynthesis